MLLSQPVDRFPMLRSLQDLYAPDPDPYLRREQFDRTEEMNEELGLHDMKTEHYGEDEPATAAAASGAEEH